MPFWGHTHTNPLRLTYHPTNYVIQIQPSISCSLSQNFMRGDLNAGFQGVALGSEDLRFRECAPNLQKTETCLSCLSCLHPCKKEDSLEFFASKPPHYTRPGWFFATQFCTTRQAPSPLSPSQPQLRQRASTSSSKLAACTMHALVLRWFENQSL